MKERHKNVTAALAADRKLRLLLDKGVREKHDIGLSKTPKELSEIKQKLIIEGGRFFQANFFSMFVCMLTGLLSLMFVPGIVTILHFTGRSGTPTLAFRRYLKTLSHTTQWYKGLCPLRCSLNRVLGAHRGADTRARLSGLEGIHQESMVLTQWAFIGPALLWPRELGLNPNDDWGMMGLVEVMAEVGRQLGVREELNMCSGGLKEAREYALLLHRRIQQHLSQPSELADDMSTQLLSGANILNPFIRPTAFRTWAFGLLNPQNTDETGLEGPDRVLFKLQGWVLSKAFHIPLVSILLRMIANNLMKLNIVLASKWEDVIVRRAENGPVFPYGLDILEPFLAIPILIILTLLSFFWALVVIWARTFYALVIGIALIVPVNFLCRFTLALTGNYFFYGYLRNNGYISGNSFISKAYITGNSFLSKAIEGFLYPSDT